MQTKVEVGLGNIVLAALFVKLEGLLLVRVHPKPQEVHIGKIVLGSLTELHLPPSIWKIQVKPGDKMKGGRSIVAYRRD